MDDEDSAVELAKYARKNFGLAEWTHERELLSLILGEIRSLFGLTVAVNSKNGRAPATQPVAWPVTALDRAHRKAAVRRHREIVAKLLPNRD